MKKILSIVGIALVVLIILAMVFLGQIVKTGIETVGPKVAGVPISVEKVSINPLTGRVHVNALVIGNPDGFNTPSAMELEQFKLSIALGSLISDTIVIKEILIDAPQITYERGLKSSNLSTLLDNLAPKEKKEDVAEKSPKEQKPAKKVVIEDFQFNNAKVNATFTAMGGKKIPLSLPSIHMTDIGKQTDGASITDVITELLGKITASVGSVAADAISGAGGLAADALKDAGGLAEGTLKSAGDMAGGALSGAGDAAGEAAKSATDAAKGAADSLKKGLGGLLGGQKE
jgi:uncharacterized protein involved in outer membrane biogenesis